MSILLFLYAKVKQYLFPSIFIVTVIILIVSVTFRCSKNTSVSQMKKLEDTYRTEIEQINRLRENELIEHQKNVVQLQTELSLIQSKYDSAKKELITLKQKKTSTIIQETNGKPEELAKRLSNVTGIPIIK